MNKLTPVEHANNAIKWIDQLPNDKQAPFEPRGELGDAEKGFCCLGSGCNTLDIDYDSYIGTNPDFTKAVGLLTDEGVFIQGKSFYGKTHLVNVNDYTNAGFKRIATLLKTHPDWMFKPEVAKLIKQHYGT